MWSAKRHKKNTEYGQKSITRAKETIVCACSKYLRDKFKIVLETREAVFEGVEFYTLTLTGKDSAQI